MVLLVAKGLLALVGLVDLVALFRVDRRDYGRTRWAFVAFPLGALGVGLAALVRDNAWTTPVELVGLPLFAFWATAWFLIATFLAPEERARLVLAGHTAIGLVLGVLTIFHLASTESASVF